ncbi:MAG: polyprenyl synthetase family protein [Chloroflexi bacterium]|nr:polyprenyl synthetase family protein [Chloroflexota bacterium]
MISAIASFDLVQDGLTAVQRALAETAQPEHPLMGPLLSMILPGSGKRLRPALTYLVGRLGVDDPARMLDMATGVELLHAASLVHDDVVDESELRRGSQTLFTRVGNALAVLVGDYLFAQSARRCVATGNVRVIGLFADTLASMCQGQIEEASRGNSPHLTLSREGYYQTIWGKTASLFVLACEGSAILTGLTETQIAAMRRFGDRLGLAFQVVDDILDFTGDETRLGKPVGSDLRQGTITLPVICLREILPPGEFSAAFAADGHDDDQDVSHLVQLVRSTAAIACARTEADRLLAEARDALRMIPAGETRDALEALTYYVVERRA